jgi:uncharacterized membrane protein YjjB (DUF3815 family)
MSKSEFRANLLQSVLAVAFAVGFGVLFAMPSDQVFWVALPLFVGTMLGTTLYDISQKNRLRKVIT